MVVLILIFFDQNSKIYKFLKSKNLKNFCNDD